MKSCLLWELLLGLEHELLSLVPAQTHEYTWEEHPWPSSPHVPPRRRFQAGSRSAVILLSSLPPQRSALSC